MIPASNIVTPASNSRECFSSCIGKTVRGVIFDALRPLKGDTTTRTLIFDDGTGLTISCDGAFWIDSADAVTEAVRERVKRVKEIERELRAVLPPGEAT